MVILATGTPAAAATGCQPLPWWLWILLLVLAEALSIVIFLPTSWSRAVGNGDGAEYQRYAFNLLHHGVFSESPAPPYHPGVVRSPGYPSFLAALEWIGGRHVVVVQGAQFALLGATSRPRRPDRSGGLAPGGREPRGRPVRDIPAVLRVSRPCS